MINMVALMGRMTYEPELRTTPSGVSVLRFQVACDRTYQKDSQKRQADFIDCVAWRQTAEFISRYFHKGSMIAVEGSIQTRKFTDKNGNNRTAFEIVANNVHFVESKKTSNVDISADPLQDVADKLNSFNANNNSSKDDMFGDILDDGGDLPFV